MSWRDWTDPGAYGFAESLDGGQWAWEFLRRNPDYQSDWQAFDRVWRALEADYGRPPERDFCAWKRDPRAWVRAADCPQGECRVDQDRVLIECALGARWGFHKFPPDPADDDPVGQGRLSWRALEPRVPIVELNDRDWLGDDPARVALGFDLALPLRAQVDHAKRLLQAVQRRRQRAGQVRPLRIRARAAEFTRLLRLLDARAVRADEAALVTIAPDWRTLMARALQLRDGGYRALPGLPP